MDDILLQQIYSIFMDKNIDVFGWSSLRTYMNIKSKKQLKALKIAFKTKYEWEIIKSHLKLKQSAFYSRTMKGKPQNHSPESDKKRAEGVRRFWKSIIGTPKEEEMRQLSRDNMRIYCAPKGRDPETYKKRIESRRNNGRPWHSEEWKKLMSELNKFRLPPSEETRQKMSDAAKARGDCRPADFKFTDETIEKISSSIKSLWESGIYDKRKSTARKVGGRYSKGHLEVERILHMMGYEVKSEFQINEKWYDIFIPSLRILLEYNGTYWHCDPRFYHKDYIHPTINKSSAEIWARDEKKKIICEENGYEFKQIWEYDWNQMKTDDDKIVFLNLVLSM